MSSAIDLDQVVRDGLEKCRGDWPLIAEQAEVSHSWISQFVRRKIPNPGIETLKSIRAALEKMPKALQALEADQPRSADNHPHQRAGDRG